MPFILLAVSSIFFLLIKLSNLGVRLSDTNVYYYTGLKILDGNALYKDIFFTNLPFFPYLTSLYLFISGKNIYFLYATSAFEATATSLLIYLCLKTTSKQALTAAGGALLYLFSFIVLATTDHQTGVFIASFFSVAGYYFFLKKRYFVSGIFLGLMMVTKAYFAPIFLSYLVYLLYKREWKNFISLLFASLCIAVLWIGPFLLITGGQFIAQTFGYSLNRIPGVSKFGVIKFFAFHDPVIFILFLFNLFNFRGNKLFFFASFFSLIFLVLYKDIYYLYLNFLVPVTILSLGDFYKSIEKINKSAIQIGAFIIIGFSLLNFIRYVNGFSTLGKISNLEELTAVINRESPQYLYGVDSLTPALAGLTNKKLVGGIVDTNENIFRAGLLNADKMTDEALKNRTIIVSRGIYYPPLEIEDNLAEGIFNKEKLSKKCKLILSSPVQAEGAVNRINLFKCY